MDSPRFSVIVPTHGRPELLREAIASVLAQSVEDLECLVVDDGGPEPVQVPDDRRVRVVRTGAEKGASAARNVGLRNARGRYVAFLDDDDLYAPDRLGMAEEALSRAPIALCLRRWFDARGEGAVWRLSLDGDVRDVIVDRPVPHVGQATIDRAVVPFFDEAFTVSEDVEWWVRLAQAGAVRTVPRVGYLLRHHDSRLQTSRTSELLRCRLLLLDRHARYFADHRRAAAHHWKRAGGFAWVLGDRRLARRAFARSLRMRPGLPALWHLARALVVPAPGRRGEMDPEPVP